MWEPSPRYNSPHDPSCVRCGAPISTDNVSYVRGMCLRCCVLMRGDDGRPDAQEKATRRRPPARLALDHPASLRPRADVYLSRSTVAGIGVFAGRRFRAGEWLLSFAEGEPEVFDRAATARDPAREGDYLQIGIDRYILPRPPSLYVNHSCEPNAGARERTELFALEEVEAGEELTFDYSTSMAEEGWEMECSCGAAGCRVRVRDFRHLPPARRLYYVERGVVADFCVESARAHAG